MLCDGVKFEEDLLSLNYKQIDSEYNDMVFYKTGTKHEFLEKYQTDIVYYGGVNPFLAIEDNKYDLYYKFSQLIVMGLTLMFI